MSEEYNCDKCSGVMANIDHALNQLDDVWDNMKEKAPVKWFYVVVFLMLAVLGFQWATYEKMTNIQVEVATMKGEHHVVKTLTKIGDSLVDAINDTKEGD